VPVAKEVHARRGRCAKSQHPLRVHLADPRRGELDEIGDATCAAFLCEPDQLHEDLGGRLSVRKRAMARPSRCAEELREGSEPGARRAALEQAAREPDSVDDGPGEAGAREPLRLTVEERQVEAGVVRNQDRVTRELEKAPNGDVRMSLSAQLRVTQTGKGADRGRERDAGIDEQLELVLELELPNAHRADLADVRATGPQSGGLQIDHDERGLLEQQLGARRLRQPDRVAAPGQAGILSDDLLQQAASEPERGVAKREEPARGLLGEDRPPPLLDELDEPVGRIEPELHQRQNKRTYVRLQGSRPMTLSQLALTVLLLGVLGLAAHWTGISSIPAYLLAGIILGPNEPHVTSLIQPSEVTEFLAELGLVFLLFFLGLEFSLDRLRRTGRHLGLGGTVDLIVNGSIGLLVGVIAFGLSFAALVLAAAIYVSSSAITVKGLIDFRRLADEETDLVLGILLFEDLVIAFVLGFAATGGGSTAATLGTLGKALVFVVASLAASRWLSGPLDLVLDRLSREFFLLFTFALLVGMAALAKELELSEAIGALMAGVVLSETSVRGEIEERFFSFRDLFAALFFFVFGLSIDVGALGRLGWLLALAVPLTILGKTAAGHLAGLIGGLTRRQSFNAGVALIAHGEFTIILAQLATGNSRLSVAVRDDLTAFAGLYVLATATIGVILMKESKWIARRLFPAPRLAAR
jgi:monovalent cation:H+ antiporter-2, CPA2 family